MSNSIANTAGEAADRWAEKNAETLEKLFAMRNDTEMEIMKAQAELYGKFYAARQAVVSKIPHFWFGAFIKHPALSMHMSPQDQEAMTYLEDLKLTHGEEGKHIQSYDLTFTFKENPFFSNTELKKSFSVTDSDEGVDVVGSVETINWKDDEHNLVKKSPRKIDETDESADGLDPGSFFTFFTEKDDIFSMGEMIRDDLLPKSAEYFAGIGEDDEDEDDFEDESGDDEDLSFDTRPTKKAKA